MESMDLVRSQGFELSREQMDKLDKYVALLKKWNNAYNLVGKSTLVSIYSRHVVDSLQLAKYIDKQVKNILDFGSGAGMPAVMLAILMPDKNIHACERIGKKCQFLNQVRRELGLDNFMVLNCDVQEIEENYDLITCRAVADISDILDLTSIVAQNGQRYLLPKGKNYKKEIEVAQLLGFNFTYKVYSSVVDEESVILEII